MLDFIVIGAQKAGSTFVQQCLQDHPQLFLPRGETPFFQDPDYSADDLSPLTDAVAGATPGQLRGIKRPNYLGLPDVPGRIARHMPAAKIIAVLREPVSRAVSAYFHYMRSGFIPVAPLEEGLPRVLSGAYESDWPLASEIVSFGLYHEHLTRYLEHFPREQVKVIILDDVKARPDETIQDLYRFLGVEASFRPVRTAERPMSAIYSLVRLRINLILKPLAMIRSPDGQRLHYRQSMWGFAARKAITGLDRHVLSRLFPGSKPKLSAELKQQLEATYCDDVDRLRTLLDHPLAGWPTAQKGEASGEALAGSARS